VRFCIKIRPFPSLDSEHSEDEANTKVAINVDDCKGVHFEKLSLKALGYSDKVSQESCNKVHEETDDLDSFLVATHFDHVFTKTDDRL
jgi:hypothetical protein